MATNFGEKYGIKNYQEKLDKCVITISTKIKQYINGHFDEHFGKFKDQMDYLKFVKYKNGKVLKFNEEGYDGLKQEFKELSDGIYYGNDMRKWEATSGLQIEGAYEHFCRECKDMKVNEKDMKVNENDEFYIPQEKLFDNMKIDYRDNTLPQWKNALFLAIGALLKNCPGHGYPEDFIDAVHNITTLNFALGISSAKDVCWGPVNKDMLKDMLENKKLYEEFILQFGLFDAVK